ncbi:MAG: alpha/beta fold hydrolase [Spirochaetaceae bacterium]|nr:MAG: alpha/beta fold hydrolase [Spirochaetaceae bacterium]
MIGFWSLTRAPRRTAATVLMLGTLLLMTACQSMFLYHPSTEREEVLLRTAARYGLEPWPEAGSGRMGWQGPAADRPEARILVMHGNAGHSLHRQYYARGFDSRFVVYLLEYPGYGSREGRPGEEAFIAAAAEAVERLLSEDSDQPIYVLGESIGSGVATQVAARYHDAVSGILLVTPFTNIAAVARVHYPRFLVNAILRDRFDNEAALAEYDGPVGFLLAGRDEVVSTELGRALYESYDGPKRLWVQDEAGHNTLDFSARSTWWEEASEFLLGVR